MSRLHRICYDTLAPELAEVTLSRDHRHFHYLVRVVRVKIDDQVELFDGCGSSMLTTIASLSRHHIVLKSMGQMVYVEANGVKYILAQALIKSDPLDIIVQKATELGVTQIDLFQSQYSDGWHAKTDSEKKIQRLQLIAQRAAEQSGAHWLPIINYYDSFTEWLDAVATMDGCKYVLDPEAAMMPACSNFNGVNQLLWCIGPEAGMSKDESQSLLDASFIPLSIPGHILRADTAAIVASGLFIWLVKSAKEKQIL